MSSYHGGNTLFGFPNLKFLSISCIILLNSLIFFPVVAQGATELYSYDANGNMIQGGDYVYDYNDDNRLTRISRVSDGSTVAEYFYDAGGQRVKKVEGGVTTYYIGSHYETRTDGNTSEDTKYFFANTERIARADPDDQVFYYHGDHLGSTSVVTNDTGVLNEKVSYLPYGAVKEHTGSGSTYLFTDQEFDPESGLYYYDARYYNPELTRFTQADTVIQDAYNPQNLNEYAYVMNNPVKYTDPSGNEYTAAPNEFRVPDVMSGREYGGMLSDKQMAIWRWQTSSSGTYDPFFQWSMQFDKTTYIRETINSPYDNGGVAIGCGIAGGLIGLAAGAAIGFLAGGVGALPGGATGSQVGTAGGLIVGAVAGVLINAIVTEPTVTYYRAGSEQFEARVPACNIDPECGMLYPNDYYDDPSSSFNYNWVV